MMKKSILKKSWLSALTAALIILLGNPTIQTNRAFAADLETTLQSSDYFLDLEEIPLPGDGQGNEGAVAQVSGNLLAVIRRQGQIEMFDLKSKTFRTSIAKIPYQEFPQRSAGERGLTGVKGATFLKNEKKLVVSSVFYENGCVRPVLMALRWNSVLEDFEKPALLVKSPTCIKLVDLPDNFPPISASNRQGQPNVSQAGGRVVQLQDGRILWAIGNFGDGWRTAAKYLAAKKDSKDWFGKTVLVTKNATTEIFTTGHRNIQGLIQASSGKIFATEHGPEGGDELNVLTSKKDYGWPQVSLGHNYSDSSGSYKSNRLSPIRSGLSFDGSVNPIFAWVPSIAPSQVVEVSKKSKLSKWQGSLISGSLRDMALHRLKIANQKVVLDERVPVAFRIRDLIWMGTKIVGLIDSSSLVVITFRDREIE